jgi:hypothetical protein
MVEPEVLLATSGKTRFSYFLVRSTGEVEVIRAVRFAENELQGRRSRLLFLEKTTSFDEVCLPEQSAS